MKSLKILSFDCNYAILEVFSRLKIYNPAVDTLTIKNLPKQTNHLKSLSKFFPNVTDLKITWPDDKFYNKHSIHYFFVELQPINSMTMVRKLEIEYTTEEMLAKLELKELREFHSKEIASTLGYTESAWDHLNNWRTFISNHGRLEVLHIPSFSLCVDKIQIMLKNFKLLNSLEFTVGHCDFAVLPKKSSEQYKKEQAEKVALMIGENYDRLEHLKLDFKDDGIRTWVLECFEEHYPGLKLNK